MYQSKYDTVVVGGGLTGVAAAVSAAREGLVRGIALVNKHVVMLFCFSHFIPPFLQLNIT